VANEKAGHIFLQTLPPPSRPLKLKQDNQLFAAWANTIFDRSSEGIEEQLLRYVRSVDIVAIIYFNLLQGN
jgi:hypothetical protein